MRNALAALVLLLSAVSLAAARPAANTTIILVRHAEKVSPTGDPALSEAGAARARELARVLADAGISAIYTTQYVRTQQTATPLATALSLTPVVVNAVDTYAGDLVAKIMADHRGETVLVTGHTNTIPQVLKRLGIKAPPVIPESEYDDIFICVVPVDGAATVVRLRYGATAR